MRLSDLFRDMQLATIGEIALLLFFGVFVAMALRAYRPGARAATERLARLPLESDSQEIGS